MDHRPNGNADNEQDCEMVCEANCEICNVDENADQSLICDSCNRVFHVYCLTPPLTSIPDGDWYCQKCQLRSNPVSSGLVPLGSAITDAGYQMMAQFMGWWQQQTSGYSFVPTTPTSQTPAAVPTSALVRSPMPLKQQAVSPQTVTADDSPQPAIGSNVYVYLRVSSRQQDSEKYGCVGKVSQKNAIDDLCNKRRLNVLAVYEDVGSGRDVSGLSGMKKLLKSVKAPATVIVYDVSRWARNVNQGLTNAKALQKRGIQVYALANNLNTGTQPGMSQFISLLNEAESNSNLMSTRTLLRNEFQRNNGGHVGVAPFGQQIVKNGRGVRVLHDHSGEQSIIKYIKQELGNDTSPETIAQKLNSQQLLKRTRPWSANMVKKYDSSLGRVNSLMKVLKTIPAKKSRPVTTSASFGRRPVRPSRAYSPSEASSDCEMDFD